MHNLRKDWGNLEIDGNLDIEENGFAHLAHSVLHLAPAQPKVLKLWAALSVANSWASLLIENSKQDMKKITCSSPRPVGWQNGSRGSHWDEKPHCPHLYAHTENEYLYIFQYGTLISMNLCVYLCHYFAYLMIAASKLFETNCNKQENRVDLFFSRYICYS